CAPQGQVIDPLNTTGMQWSPDQKHIMFTQGANYDPQQGSSPSWSIFLLDLYSGKVQLAFAPAKTDGYFELDTWFNTMQISLLQQTDQGRVLYLLDTRKAPISHI